MFVSLVENAVYRYPCKAMEGWRFYRIEYCGANQDCCIEGGIWLPPEMDSDVIEELLTYETCGICGVRTDTMQQHMREIH